MLLPEERPTLVSPSAISKRVSGAPEFGGQDLGVLDDELGGARDGAAWPVRPASVALPALAWHVGFVVGYLPDIPYAPAHHGVDKGEEQKQEQGLGREKRHL
jgi:hypothetical protein